MCSLIDRGRLVSLVLGIAAASAAMLAWAMLPADRPGSVGHAAAPSSDPVAAELLRCRRLGAQALGDGRCWAAWDAQRRRFLEQTSGRRS